MREGERKRVCVRGWEGERESHREREREREREKERCNRHDARGGGERGKESLCIEEVVVVVVVVRRKRREEERASLCARESAET